MKGSRYLTAIWMLLCCTSIVLAQDEEINAYMSGFNTMPLVIETIIWSAVYLAIYAAAIFIPLGFLQLFSGFETEMLIWVGVLWLGGMIINALAFAITGYHRLWADLLAIPLLFGWAVLVNTRNFADLTMKDAVRVALVVALVCAPHFGPTWRLHLRQKPPVTEESRSPMPGAIPTITALAVPSVDGPAQA